MVSLPPCEAEAPRNSREVRRNFCGRKRGFPKIQPLYPGDFRRKHSEKIHFCQRFTEKSVHLCCRSPHGERGLKYSECLGACVFYRSLPPRGAWIEIRGTFQGRTVSASRSPHGERGLKFSSPVNCQCKPGSLPPRGAWIEMPLAAMHPCRRFRRSPHGERGLKSQDTFKELVLNAVAPPTGSVD